ncbi:hypothetical protein BJY59DRAFT_478213 [Rhodotorula toruloides]
MFPFRLCGVLSVGCLPTPSPSLRSFTPWGRPDFTSTLTPSSMPNRSSFGASDAQASLESIFLRPIPSRDPATAFALAPSVPAPCSPNLRPRISRPRSLVSLVSLVVPTRSDSLPSSSRDTSSSSSPSPFFAWPLRRSSEPTRSLPCTDTNIADSDTSPSLVDTCGERSGRRKRSSRANVVDKQMSGPLERNSGDA